jgi:hypothetical protein
MPSLKERIELLEDDMRSRPPRISVYHDLPFAVLRYDPSEEIERQEEFVSELRDFAEKLGRAARLDFGDAEKLDSGVTYDPDLNDGVVLNIAPLHELVPWREAKSYWDALLKGEYEWSSIGEQLRAKGLVK